MNSKRIGAFFIDYIITALIMNIPFFILVIIPMINKNIPGNNEIISRTLFSTFIALLYLLLRDLPNNCSIGKKLLKLRVVDSVTKEQATKTKKIVRNITWFLGPIEIIFFIITKKRIGDLIAKTDIVIIRK